MRRLILLAILISFLPFPARAVEQITILSTPHRIADGRFDSNQLSQAIAPDGELGTKLFTLLRTSRDVFIDVAALEEIQDIADGYTYLDENGDEIDIPESSEAALWLVRFKAAVVGKRIHALPYGNPDRGYLAVKAPAEYRLCQEIGKSRLGAFLGQEVIGADSLNLGERTTIEVRNFYNSYRPILRNIYRGFPAPEVLQLRLDLSKLLNPGVSTANLDIWIESLRAEISKSSSAIRIASGNYTITSSNYDLPVTVINDFSIPISIKLKVSPSNSRIIVGELLPVSIPANSQVQVKLPLEVIASGETDLMIQIRSLAGRSIGEVSRIPIRLAVISPLTTWFTTGMAIILLLGAVIQSMRRVRRRGRDEPGI